MSHTKFAGALVLLVVSIASIVMLNDGGVQSRADQPLRKPPADQPLEKPPTALADSEPVQQALEKLKSSGAGVNTASFGIQVFLSRRPERPVWDILARVGVRRLHLNGDWVTDSDLQQVKRLGSLELLYLSAPQVDDAGIAAISQLSGLRDLTLRNVNLTDAGLAQLSHLSQLDTLQIIGSKHVHGSGLSFLHTLSLHELLLEGISLDDEPLTQLSNFRQLGRVEICDARLTDAAVPRLRSLAAGMKRLALRLRGTGISPQGLALLRRDVPGLEVVRKDVSPGLENLRAIGIALAGEPELLLLDEPTSGMSPAETNRMIELIASLPRGLSLLMIEHDMQVVFSVADRITVLYYGKVLATGAPAEIKANDRVREVYLGMAH